MNNQIRNKKIIHLTICLLFIFSMGCKNDRASSITTPQAGASSGTTTLEIQLTKTVVGVNETFDITLNAIRSTGFAEGTWPFSYTATSKISASSGQKTVTVGEVAAPTPTTLAIPAGTTSIGVVFEGITATKPGLVSITGNFNGDIAVSTELQIVGE